MDVSKTYLSQIIPGAGLGYDQLVQPFVPAGGSSPSQAQAVNSVPSPATGAQAAQGLKAFSITWWLVMLAVLIGLMLLARLLGKGEGFSNIKLSAYNLLVIGLAAVLGISFYKGLFGTFRVPYLSALVEAV